MPKLKAVDIDNSIKGKKDRNFYCSTDKVNSPSNKKPGNFRVGKTRRDKISGACYNRLTNRITRQREIDEEKRK